MFIKTLIHSQKERTLFRFLKKRFLHRFIIVYLESEKIKISFYDVKNFIVQNSDSVEFEREESDSLGDEVINFLNTLQQKVTKSYIVTLINSSGQGIIPTCTATKFSDYNIDRKYIYNICLDNSFTNFVSKAEIKWIQKIFFKTGIDLIFSPFTLLYMLFSQNPIKSSEVELHILYQTQSTTLIVTKGKKVLYGSFFNTFEEKNLLYTDFEKQEEEEDSFEIEDEFDFEDEEFDFEDGIGEDEILEDNLEDDNSSELDYKKELELIETNKNFAHSLSSTLKDFYSNPLYESSFIDSVTIYSEEKIDESIVEFIENELFLSVKIQKIDLDEEVLKLIYKEVF